MSTKPAYAAAVWAAVFALVSFYWAAGGETEAWVAGVLKVLGALVGLALARHWEPRRRYMWAALIGGAVIAVYGASEIIEKLLIKLDVTPLGDDHVDWYLFLWDPLWMLGGVLFILAALSVSIPGNPVRRDGEPNS